MIHAEQVGTPNATRMHAHEPDAADPSTGRQILAYIERVERLNEEIAALNEDKKEVYSEAKGNGFDTAVLKEIVKHRAQDPDKRAEKETLLDLYTAAIRKAQS